LKGGRGGNGSKKSLAEADITIGLRLSGGEGLECHYTIGAELTRRVLARPAEGARGSHIGRDLPLQRARSKSADWRSFEYWGWSRRRNWTRSWTRNWTRSWGLLKLALPIRRLGWNAAFKQIRLGSNAVQ
jgi:hypothetical protein